MAQVLAVPGDRRHGFDSVHSFSHDFGRITGIAVSKENNVLLCDYIKNQLLLFDEEGNYLIYLPLTASPWDVAISNQNIAYVTMTTDREQCILQVDPDKLCVVAKTVFENPNTLCVSSAMSMKEPDDIYLGYISGRNSYVQRFCGGVSCTDNHVGGYDVQLCKQMAIKLHTVGTSETKLKYYSCVSGQNHFAISTSEIRNYLGHTPANKLATVEFPTLRVPSDICSDDNGHVYVSGQYSHNIHRLTEDDKVIDIPLSSQHGIKYPVAMCFNRNYTKLYIVNECGKSVMVFNVI